MAPFFSDTFTGSDGTTLQAHTPDVGTSWTRLFGTGGTLDFEINTNAARPDATAGNSGLIYTADASYPSADYEAQLTLTTLAPQATSPLFLFVRIADVNNMYAVYLQSGTGTCRLYKRVAGTWTALGSTFDAPANGSVCKLEIIGTALKFYDDGVEVASATDSDLSAAGSAGIGCGGGAQLVTSTDDTRQHVFDSFTVTDLASGGAENKSVTDTGAGTDGAPALSVIFSLSDTGAGNDAAPAPAASLPLTDLGSAVDLLSSLLASVPVTDSGSGDDAVSLLTALLKTVTDLAAGQDSDPDIRVTFSLLDTGVGSEDPSTPTVQARFTVADLALGADGPSVRVALTITDLGSADALLNLITATLITITEIAQGTDLIGTITVSVPVLDLGSAVESFQQLLVDLALSDLGTGVEVVSAFNSATRLVDITFRLSARSINFDLTQRSIELSELSQRSISFSLS